MFNLGDLKKMFKVGGRNKGAQPSTKIVVRRLTASDIWQAYEAGYNFPNCRVLGEVDGLEYSGMEKNTNQMAQDDFTFWRAGGDEFASRLFGSNDRFVVVQLQVAQ